MGRGSSTKRPEFCAGIKRTLRPGRKNTARDVVECARAAGPPQKGWGRHRGGCPARAGPEPACSSTRVRGSLADALGPRARPRRRGGAPAFSKDGTSSRPLPLFLNRRLGGGGPRGTRICGRRSSFRPAVAGDSLPGRDRTAVARANDTPLMALFPARLGSAEPGPGAAGRRSPAGCGNPPSVNTTHHGSVTSRSGGMKWRRLGRGKKGAVGAGGVHRPPRVPVTGFRAISRQSRVPAGRALLQQLTEGGPACAGGLAITSRGVIRPPGRWVKGKTTVSNRRRRPSTTRAGQP